MLGHLSMGVFDFFIMAANTRKALAPSVKQGEGLPECYSAIILFHGY